MAELVDALVSNTSGFTSMPVRSRLWVLNRTNSNYIGFVLFLFLVIDWFAGILGLFTDYFGSPDNHWGYA